MESYRKEFWFNIPARRGFVNLTLQTKICLRESDLQKELLFCNAMHITASTLINDDVGVLRHDHEVWLEGITPRESLYWPNRTGEDNADAHLKRQVMGSDVSKSASLTAIVEQSTNNQKKIGTGSVIK